jgi:hypothetical protein
MNFELVFCSYIDPFILSCVQKNAEDESCTIALNNLRSEVIRLRNEATKNTKFYFHWWIK